MNANFEEITGSSYVRKLNRTNSKKVNYPRRSCIAVASVKIPKSSVSLLVKASRENIKPAKRLINRKIKTIKEKSKQANINNIYRAYKENTKEFIDKKIKANIINFVNKLGGTHKTAIAISLAAIMIIACTAGITYRPAIEVAYNNKSIGIIQNKYEYDKILKESLEELNAIIGREVVIEQDPTLKKRWITKKDLTKIEKVKENLKDIVDISIVAYAIVVDGQQTVLASDENTANEILAEIKNGYANEECVEVKFLQDINIEKVVAKIAEVDEKEGVIAKLKSTKNQVETYSVKETDTLWNIALSNHISIDEIMNMNPGLTENIYPEQKINLSVAEPILSVQTKKVVEYEEDIPFEKKTINDSNMYVGKKEIVESGKLGKCKVEAEVVSINGIEQTKDILNTLVLQEPQIQTEKIGTKPVPVKAATGIFRRPTYGTLTSRFGRRWGGEMHTGIDLAGKTGDPISAADGGKVIFSGWQGGYGNLVKIDHGNGYVTYYGHCSKLLVKVGQKVAKGETIANLGSTGRSTGPHLHFEVRQNGTPQNPLNYLN